MDVPLSTRAGRVILQQEGNGCCEKSLRFLIPRGFHVVLESGAFIVNLVIGKNSAVLEAGLCTVNTACYPGEYAPLPLDRKGIEQTQGTAR